MEKTDDKPVGRDSDKFMLRFPEGMREHIAALAKHNGRSMNAEIISRLEESLESQERAFDMLADIRGQLTAMGELMIAQEERREPHERTQPPDQLQALREQLKIPPSLPPRRGKKKGA